MTEKKLHNGDDVTWSSRRSGGATRPTAAQHIVLPTINREPANTAVHSRHRTSRLLLKMPSREHPSPFDSVDGP